MKPDNRTPHTASPQDSADAQFDAMVRSHLQPGRSRQDTPEYWDTLASRIHARADAAIRENGLPAAAPSSANAGWLAARAGVMSFMAAGALAAALTMVLMDSSEQASPSTAVRVSAHNIVNLNTMLQTGPSSMGSPSIADLVITTPVSTFPDRSPLP